MSTKWLSYAFALLLFTVLPFGTAQERGRFGVGFYTALPRPLAAITLKADVTDALSVEGVVGPLGTLSTYGLKASYSFVFRPAYRIYGFGTGLLGSDPGYYADYFGDPVTVLTVGGGAGIEFSYAALFGTDSALPIWANLDLGFASRSLAGPGVSIYFGSGVSFRF